LEARKRFPKGPYDDPARFLLSTLYMRRKIAENYILGLPNGDLIGRTEKRGLVSVNGNARNHALNIAKTCKFLTWLAAVIPKIVSCVDPDYRSDVKRQTQRRAVKKVHREIFSPCDPLGIGRKHRQYGVDFGNAGPPPQYARHP
jgi:hypothetical protein